MSDIQVGDFVRLRGEILQIEFITNRTEEDIYIKFKEYASGNTFSVNEIKEWKHSPYLIELIECGDYVNGEKVLQINCKLEYIDDDTDTGVNEIDDGLELESSWIYFEEQIETIVTHEQFNSVIYKVKE